MTVDCMTVTDVNVVKSAIFERPDDANKGTLGSLLCVCGNNNGCGCSGGGNDCCWLILLLLFCGGCNGGGNGCGGIF